MNWLAKYKFYLLPWVVLLAYLFVADPVYYALFVKNGKPVYQQSEAFEAKGKIKLAVDALVDLHYAGEDVYELRGWAFTPEIPDLKNAETQIVLRSVDEDLIFDRIVWQREKLNEVIPEPGMDLTDAGYRVRISKYALDIGIYEIGILITDKTTGEQYFRLTGLHIERSPNSMRYIN